MLLMRTSSQMRNTEDNFLLFKFITVAFLHFIIEQKLCNLVKLI